MKNLIGILILSLTSLLANGQYELAPAVDSISFCNKMFKAPDSCYFIPNGMVRCDNYALVWVNVDIEEIERHKSESFDQLKNPKEINCRILGQDVIAYKTKFKPGISFIYDGVINSQAVLIQIWLSKNIKTNEEIPSFLRQIFELN